MIEDITLVNPEPLYFFGGFLVVFVIFLIYHLICKYGSKQGINYWLCLLFCIVFSPILMLLVFVILDVVNKRRRSG